MRYSAMGLGQDLRGIQVEGDPSYRFWMHWLLGPSYLLLYREVG